MARKHLNCGPLVAAACANVFIVTLRSSGVCAEAFVCFQHHSWLYLHAQCVNAALQVSVLGACLGEPASACLIMELVEGGSLAERIHDRRKRRLNYLQILQASSR